MQPRQHPIASVPPAAAPQTLCSTPNLPPSCSPRGPSRRAAIRLLALLLCFGFTQLHILAQQPSHADSRCELSADLERSDRYNFHLAVAQKGGWLICPSNDPTTLAYEVDLSGPQRLRWAVPASDTRNVVYASTVVKPNQPLSLYRNSALGIFISLAQYLYPVEDTVQEIEMLGSDLKKGFVKYHLEPEKHTSPTQLFAKSLAQWHDTGLWRTERPSREVVRRALEDVDKQLLVSGRGAERLLRIKGGREDTSWIEFRSQRPRPRRPDNRRLLAVTLSYDGEEPYEFSFVESE